MRIGMMLRTLDEKGGINVYSNNLIQELLTIDSANHYVLFYWNADHIGRFRHHKNVTERVIRASNKAFWDQIAIPYACLREKVDLLFHPKFTVPFLAPCKTIMVVHGADWFIPEHAQYYDPKDVRYIKIFLPLYCKKADSIISVSQITTDNFNRILGLPVGKMKTVYFAPAKFFKRVQYRQTLDRVKKQYHLPDRFIFSLSKYGIGGGNRKNIDNLLHAFGIYYHQSDHPLELVIGGKDCEKYLDEYNIPREDYGGHISFPGWIEQQDLPAIYSLADLYLYPSNLEAFPIPLTEAMACGTPIITSKVNGLKEIAGEAALFVDQENPHEIAQAISKVLTDDQLRRTLSLQGLERSKMFSWEKCARETLKIIEDLN